ncbi:MAG: GNAT family N-acetyltransferase [Adhaeribacter sp.]
MIDKQDETLLGTEDLLLRPYQEADAPAFYQLIRDNEDRLAPAFPGRIRLTQSLDECRRLLLQFKSDWLLGQVYAFGIWEKASQAYIGDISLKNFDRSVPKAEIGYYLGRQVEGRGYGTQMLGALLHFAFRDLNLNKVFLRSATDNPRSYALAERCGFRREGLMHQDFRDHNQHLIDIYYYGLTKSDYLEGDRKDE